MNPFERSPDFEFGFGYIGWKVGWAPDRELNPQYEGVADHPFVALALKCGPHEQTGSVHLDRGWPNNQGVIWNVEQEDPLTLSPSIAATCGCHGFIREGAWVNA